MIPVTCLLDVIKCSCCHGDCPAMPNYFFLLFLPCSSTKMSLNQESQPNQVSNFFKQFSCTLAYDVQCSYVQYGCLYMYNVHVHIQCTYAPKLVQVNVRYANISCLIFVGKGHQPKFLTTKISQSTVHCSALLMWVLIWCTCTCTLLQVKEENLHLHV